MKKSTYLALALIVVTPFVLFALSFIRKEVSQQVVNLNEKQLVRVHPMTTVVIANDEELLDSANLALQLILWPAPGEHSCSVTYSPLMVKAVQQGDVLHIGLTDKGRQLIRQERLFLQRDDLSKINPDTIHQNDTLTVLLTVTPALKRIVAQSHYPLLLQSLRSSTLTIDTEGSIVLSRFTAIDRLQLLHDGNLELYNSRVRHLRQAVHAANGRGAAVLGGDSYTVDTLVVTGDGGIAISDPERVKHVILEPDKDTKEGIVVSFGAVRHRCQVK